MFRTTERSVSSTYLHSSRAQEAHNIITSVITLNVLHKFLHAWVIYIQCHIYTCTLTYIIHVSWQHAIDLNFKQPSMPQENCVMSSNHSKLTDRPFTLALSTPTMSTLKCACLFTHCMHTRAFMVKCTYVHIKNYLHKHACVPVDVLIMDTRILLRFS